ncbi:MAG: hypothetical protein IPM45_02645 [Acidimicrobiales bacterium]|nr:hypothetical protein [Acidimicrobiales bacterium]
MDRETGYVGDFGESGHLLSPEPLPDDDRPSGPPPGAPPAPGAAPSAGSPPLAPDAPPAGPAVATATDEETGDDGSADQDEYVGRAERRRASRSEPVLSWRGWLGVALLVLAGIGFLVLLVRVGR